MKKVLAILILISIFVVGCTQETTTTETQSSDESTTNLNSDLNDYDEVSTELEELENEIDLDDLTF